MPPRGMENMVYKNYGITLYVDSLEETLKQLPVPGVKHLEINFLKSIPPSSAFDKQGIRRIKKTASASRAKLSFHLPYSFNISDIIPSIRKMSSKFMRESIEAAGKIEATHITIHIGTFYWFPVARWMRKKALDRFITNIKPILEICKTHRVKLALENVAPIPQGSDYYYLGDNINDFKYIFDKIDSDYLGFCLDTGHANLGEGVIEYINQLGDKIINIHFHDNNSTNDDHRTVGDGNINWQDVIRALVELKYKGPIISECRDKIKYQSIELIDKYFKNLYENRAGTS